MRVTSQIFSPKSPPSIPVGGHHESDLLNSLKNHADMKNTDIIMIFNVKEKKSYLDLLSSRNGCLFSKYCSGSFSRSNLSPAKEELSQHTQADINTSLELYISRGSVDRELGSLPQGALMEGRASFPFQDTKGLCLIVTEAGAKKSILRGTCHWHECTWRNNNSLVFRNWTL